MKWWLIGFSSNSCPTITNDVHETWYGNNNGQKKSAWAQNETEARVRTSTSGGTTKKELSANINEVQLT